MPTALVGARVFDGKELRSGRSVTIEGERIVGVVPDESLPSRADRIDCSGGVLAPGFIDVQVNGGGGLLFNAHPTVQTLRTMAAAHRRYGTTSMVPTLISDSWETMVAAANAVAQARANAEPGILGLHFEGPYLNPEKKGVHSEQHVRSMDPGFLQLVSRRDLGKVVVTLAPECVPSGTIAALVAAGVCVSLGHTAANYDQTIAALDEGATGFTHLFNAMSPLGSREPGTVGAALADPRSYLGIIVDGHHVDPVTLRIALRVRGPGAAMLVTDAMSTVGSDLDTFDLFGHRVTRAGNRLTTSTGMLAGSHLDMSTAVRNAVTLLSVTLEQALAMASRQPAAFLGLQHDRGRIDTGYRADLVLLDDSLTAKRVWVDGREIPD